MKLLLLCTWWLSHALVVQIYGHCLRQPLPTEKTADAATRHMWRATGWPADTGSCAGPTTLRSATDSVVAVAAGNATANASANATAHATSVQVVSLANYVYQCAAKRAPNLSPDLRSTQSLHRPLQLHLQQRQLQQLTVPAIALKLVNICRGKDEEMYLASG
ncbi:uncharacterized protein LOC111604993 [Drosophila hydei]|uniref:Uncharacterized protein LOC111604993 n=1 Tax=Drosophila hydei TaxID=7224 RepID=A0A6J1MPZ3_DROHY|nr:uncharacterized protein LOC111604993 [Drosophila hydei]